jgi:monovalent cation:H+ antiporter-2, CPA2 family
VQPIPLLQEIAVVATVAVVVAVVVGRIRLPAVAGLLLSGALVGPHGLKLVSDVHAIEVIAEVGVVLLLFTIGLEFSLERLRHIFRRVVLGGVMQVCGTIAVVVAAAVALGVGGGAAVFYGFVFALSSTAIVLRTLTERRELDAPHGRFIVGALILQDLCVVPMVLLVPLLGGSGEGAGSLSAIALALGTAAAVVVGVLGLSRLVVPRVLKLVEASRSREVFLLGVLALCVGTAWLTSLAGLSLALGAFLGGMVVADTEYSHRAMGDMLPLRDVFVSFFFVSLGMFFDVRIVVAAPAVVALLLLGFIVGKGVLATAAALLMRFPARAAWLAGVGLAQFGEFGFVLVRLGTASGVVDVEQTAPLLNAGIISMFLTPLLVLGAPHIRAGERVLVPLARLLRARSTDEDDNPSSELRDHVVVIGYGLAGHLVTASLRHVGVKHVILDLNADNIREGRSQHDPVYYADATSEEAVEHAHVQQARAVVVLINDPQAAFRVIDTIRRVSPKVPIFIRTRYLGESESLVRVGASDVVAEEVEGGVEILARLLRELEIPRNVIDAEVHAAREATQESARALTVPRRRWSGSAQLSGLKVEGVLVLEGSAAACRSPRQLDLRAETGALLVAVLRGDTLLPHPPPDEALRPGDVAYLIGDKDAVRKAIELLGQPAGDE